jgi:hypothetical protein
LAKHGFRFDRELLLAILALFFFFHILAFGMVSFVYRLVISGIPKSRQILRAKKEWISPWRGTVELRRDVGLKNTLCLEPSRRKTHPSFWR